MRHLKMLGLAAFAAMAFTAFVGASTASATTLEIAGVTQNGPVVITASVKSGNTTELKDTFGFFSNTCNESHVAGETEKNFSTKPTGKITLSFAGCENTVTVHKPGKLYVEWLSGTNGRVYSEEAEVTTWSIPHQTHVNCTTGAGTLIGTLTGKASNKEHAILDVNATLTCGPHIHSAKWTGTYTVTSPTGLGVSP